MQKMSQINEYSEYSSMLKLNLICTSLGSIPWSICSALSLNFNATLYADDASNHYLNTLRSCNIFHSFQSSEEQSFINYIYNDVFNHLEKSMGTKD